MKAFSPYLLPVSALLAAAYGILVLAFVATSPDIRLRCLLTDEAGVRSGPGVVIAATFDLERTKGAEPAVGDRLLEVAGHRVRNFVDYARALQSLRGAKLDPGGALLEGADPSELNEVSSLTLVEESGQRYARVRFLPAGQSRATTTWLPLRSHPAGSIFLSLLWFVLQGTVLIVAAMAYWSRPREKPLRQFFILAILTLPAFIGGNHWWAIAGSTWLLVPFALTAIFFPAALLHFFCVFPQPGQRWNNWSGALTAAIYAVPCLVAVAVSGGIFATWELRDLGADLTQAAWMASLRNSLLDGLLAMLRMSIYGYIVVAGTYFATSLIVLVTASRRVRGRRESQQVRWILAAGFSAAIPVAYTLVLAWMDRPRFALGDAQVPMFLASVAFMLAYSVGIARYRLMLVDELIDRGVAYYLISFLLTTLFSLTVSFSAVLLLSQDLSVLGHPLWVTLVLALGVGLLAWGRNRIQNLLDHRLFQENYPLDEMLQRVQLAVSHEAAQDVLAERMLAACQDVLQVSRGALYILRDGQWRLLTSAHWLGLPPQLSLSETLKKELLESGTVQRAPAGRSQLQQLLAQLDAALVHGVPMGGQVVALLVLGPRPDRSGFTGEDAAFLTAIGQIAGVALEYAEIQTDLTRLKEDLQSKIETIAEQDRHIRLLERELSSLQRIPEAPGQASTADEFALIRGKSKPLLQVISTAKKAAASDASVLIRGESGTGKELLARALHMASGRKDGPMVTVNCAALSPTLLESELFGHVRGAFTGASSDKIGRFELANTGTLFLDEIGDVPLETQVKLLRVLQERIVERVGSSEVHQVDVRLIAATHQNLEQFIATGKFREDLYYRLNVISLHLPPLRDRREDIVDLATTFLHQAAERAGKQVTHIEPRAMDRLLAYEWPGNIRELQNVIERAAVLTDVGRIRVEDLPPQLIDRTGAASGAVRQAWEVKPSVPARLPVDLPQDTERTPASDAEQDERARLVSALEKADGNKAEAARYLDMPRSTLFSKLKKYGLQ